MYMCIGVYVYMDACDIVCIYSTSIYTYIFNAKIQICICIHNVYVEIYDRTSPFKFQ